MWKRLDSSGSSSKKLWSVSDMAYRVWANILPWTDRWGRITADLVFLRSQCLPRCRYSDDELERAIWDLEMAKLIHMYEAGGEKYLVYHNHDDHNPPGHIKNQRSQYPAPPNDLCECILGPVRTPPQDDPSNPLEQYLYRLFIGNGGYSIGPTNGTKHIRFAIDRGAKKEEIEAAFSNPEKIKSKKIWELLDPITPKNGNGADYMAEVWKTLESKEPKL